MDTTAGQLLVNAALPAALRRKQHTLDKKGVRELLRQVADKYPDQYKEIVHKLMKLGHHSVQSTGSSISLSATLPPPEIEIKIKALKEKVRDIAESDIPDKAKDNKIIKLVGTIAPAIKDELFELGKINDNPFAIQAISGSRGNPSQLQQISAGDMLVMDHRDRIIPVPVLNGYAEGLDPAQYFAASFGARKGIIDTKFATQRAGFLSKQLTQATHRLTITEHDCGGLGGITVDGGDPDNVGAVTADGKQLTPKDVKALRGKQITVRSAMTCQSRQGICAKCSGAREKGRLPDIGDNIGVPAAQAISEKVSQGQLSSKHSGGVVGGGPTKSGFEVINRLVQVPKHFKDAATLANLDGRVEKIHEAPQGGNIVTIGGEEHYVPSSQELTVKNGDVLEAGDILSNGIPNPAEVVKHKGLGEGRLYFMQAFQNTLKESGMSVNRRNIEVLARGMVTHVKITDNDGFGGFLPDDIVPYDEVRSRYEPRRDSELLKTNRSQGKYLESPALHYTIGTRITPRVQKGLQAAGIMEVQAHADPPPFEPMVVRAMESATKDPNWLTRLGGSYLQKGFLDAVHRSRTAPTTDTSFIPGLAQGSTFGSSLRTTGKY